LRISDSGASIPCFEALKKKMNQSAPLVAICTPVYNGGKFLAETMECVQAQTYQNLVHVVLDNASTDDTPEIIQQYVGARTPILTARNKDTLPLEENWNGAVALAPGEAKYVRVLCADDTMSREAVAKMVAAAERYPGVGLVGCQHHRQGPAETSGWPHDREHFSGREALEHILLGKGMILATHVLMRRDALDLSQPLYKRGLVASDTQMCLRVLTKADWAFVHEDLATTRVHAGSVTNALAAPTQIQYFEGLMLLKEFGPAAFPPDCLADVLTRFRRSYRRRILRWRMEGLNTVHARHMAALSEIGEAPTALDYGDAILDWLACKIGLRRGWPGYPFFA
jgi:glycosyltransferase involved in cell wall biosynthesis